MDIDFSKIRPLGRDQRKGFEELVCQLARIDSPEPGAKFYRVEGAGGDGGVECYWQLSNGRKVGYQAKYFLKSGGISWSQIERSVSAARASHPELIRYVIAFPCDLTGPTQRGTKSGIAQWDQHVENWKSSDSALGINIEYVLWTQSDLLQKLASNQPHILGLRHFWFDTLAFSHDWFQEKLKKAISGLGERFHPDDHVEMDVNHTLETLINRDLVKTRLLEQIDRICNSFNKVRNYFPSEKLNTIQDIINKIITVTNNLTDNMDQDVPFEDYSRYAEEIKKIFSECKKSLEQRISKEQITNDKELRVREYQLVECRIFEESLNGLSLEYLDDIFKVHNKRIVLLQGRAGSGKSHLLAHFAEQAHRKKHPVILFLGHQFYLGGPTHQFRELLYIPERYSWEDILATLDAAAHTERRRAVLMIDALNEGSGSEIWRNHLDDLCHEITKFPMVSFIVSCRIEYAEYIIPENFRKTAIIAECRGFVSQTEIENAARVYMDKMGIIRPAVPWLAPEFTNPLFLRTCCTTLKESGQREFPRGLFGTQKIFRFYLDSLEKKICTSSTISPKLPKGSLSRLMVGFAGKMAEVRKEQLSHVETLTQIKLSLGTSWTGDCGILLETLQREGALLDIPIIHSNAKDPLAVHELVYRFTFQRFSDHLIVQSLLENENDPSTLFREKGPLSLLLSQSWRWAGILEALTIQCVEKFKSELLDLFPKEITDHPNATTTHDQLEEAFLESLIWRPSEKQVFTDRTYALFDSVLSRGEHVHRCIDILVRLSVADNHPWQNRLNSILHNKNMADRDEFWSVTLAEAEGEDAAPQLIDWALGNHVDQADEETLYNAATSLCWCLSTSDRTLRDRATKGLVNLFQTLPKIIIPILKSFATIDDLYILERIYAAIYGAILIGMEDDALQKTSEVVFNCVFSSEQTIPHILLRDYARWIIEHANRRNLFPASLPIDKARPPWKSTWPFEEVSDEYIENIRNTHKASAITLSTINGDFGIYEVNSRLGFKNKTNPDKGFDPTPVQRWIVKKCIDMGWTWERFEQFERRLAYAGRSRSIVERIGKKYQWIAFSEALARLSDNLYLFDPSDDCKVSQHDRIGQIHGIRDVELSIIQPQNKEKSSLWKKNIPTQLTPVTDDPLNAWLKSDTVDLFNDPSLIETVDQEGVSWLNLSDFHLITETNSTIRSHGDLRRESWSRISSFIINRSDLSTVTNGLDKECLTDPTISEPPQVYNGPFLGEPFWHPSWQPYDRGWETDQNQLTGNAPFINPVLNHRWEGHMDQSLPDGIDLHIPSPWLAREMGLRILSRKPGSWVDSNEKLIFMDPGFDHNTPSAAWIHKEIFLSFLEQHQLVCIWIIAGEKILQTGEGTKINHESKRHSGFCHHESSEWVHKRWICR
ncbi:MAG: hypothetical protein HQL75_11330 [Magnetococcales bacterium]|nr:hypothetical protein [Magnetococcales bacterium]